MKAFPTFHALSTRKVVIAGSGEAAAQKARLAEAAGAQIVFAASGLAPALVNEWSARAEFDAKTPSDETFAGAALAFVAPENSEEAAHLASLARRAGVPVNVVDRPELSDFITPSIVDRGDIVVAISSGGAAPVLARRIREKIETLLPSRIGALAAFAASFRKAVAAKFDKAHRRHFWESFFDGPIASQVLAGDEVGAREAVIDLVNRPRASHVAGVVHIVGAGPGDPELLTLKALRLLQSADVILYDRLVSADILNLARRDAQRFYVGKAKGAHSVPQDDIEDQLIEHARAGRIVVRLKGGDPFVFGRGGEELDAVKAAGIPVYVTPGITAATGCAASAGVPLTHREISQAVTFVTGHAQGDEEPDLDWNALAALGHTLVIYMGVGKAELIARALIANGRAPSTPVAVIEKGTTANEKIFKGDVAHLGALVRNGGVEGPALLIIGEVAAKANGIRIEEIEAAQRKAA
jgi:uroporphyrin-III C-methyltransferase/precorrin-2 dehydrogenase/sirohydrochlorin ferrochelatase